MSPVLAGDLTSPTAGPILHRPSPAVIIKTGRRGIVDFVAVDANEHRPGTWARFLYDDDGEERSGYVWGANPLPEPRPLDVIRLSAIGLDLDDPAGMDLAARWLARHHGLTVGATAPTWTRFGGISPVWCLHGPTLDLWFASGGRSAVDRCATNIFDVPGISALTDPAEALALACLAAGGR